MIDELPRRRLLVVLMHRHHAHLEPVGIEQTLAVARIFGCDHVDRAEHGERAQRHVMQITERRRHHIQ